MISQLVSLLASQPDLITEHLAGYAQLASVQAGEASRRMGKRLALKAGVAASALLGLGLTGVSLLFVATTPISQMPAPWLLVLIPAMAFIATLVFALVLSRQESVKPFKELRHQLMQDAALFRQANDKSA